MTLGTESLAVRSSEAQARVLVFDDSPTQLAAVTKELQAANYLATGVECPDDAVALAESFTPDVVVCDIRIDPPRGRINDGIVAFALIRRVCPFAEPVFLSAYSGVGDYVKRTSQYGATILPKPLVAAQLLESVRSGCLRSRERRLAEWLRIASDAERKGVDPDLLLTFMVDVLRSDAVPQTDVPAINPSPGLVGTVAEVVGALDRSRGLLPVLIGLFGKELPELQGLLAGREDRLAEIEGRHARAYQALREAADDEK